MHALISFLGKQGLGYRKTVYQLNQHQFETSFMGLGLINVIGPEKLLLIGTSDSMWDVFFEEQKSEDEAVLELIEKVGKKEITEDFLARFVPKLEEQLGCQVECIVIDYAVDERQQVALLKNIADKLNTGDTLSIDVTHSFRHLPMLALVAARFLKNAKNIQTEHIYYGAFEMKKDRNAAEEPAPVIDLSGMLTMLDWVDALSAYQQSDNYAAFSSLLEKKPAELLQEAAFFENINQIYRAQSPLTRFQTALNQNEIDNPFLPLVQESLEKRIEWAKGSGQYEHQLNLAKRNLKNGDYLQTVIRTHEAWISKMVKLEEADRNQSDYGHRQEAQEYFKMHAANSDLELFKDIQAMRNAMAHGTRAMRKGINDILNNESELNKKLNSVLQRIEQWKY